MKLLNAYGPGIAKYEGMGDLIVEGTPYPGSFEAIQCSDGRILLAGYADGLDRPWDTAEFRGFTQDPGYEVRAEGIQMARLHMSPGVVSYLGAAKRMSACRTGRSYESSSAVFDLVNLRIGRPSAGRFDPIDMARAPNEVRIECVPSYKDEIESLRASAPCAITAACTVRDTDGRLLEFDATEELVDRVCFMASLLTGNKVTWVSYRTRWSRSSDTLIVHRSAPTKPFTTNASVLIWEPNVREALGRWFNGGLCESQPLQLRRLIDAWLDALGMADVESRALSASSLIDVLASQHAAQTGAEHLLSPSQWRRIEPKVRDAIKHLCANSGIEAQLWGKTAELNRRTFVDKLESALAAHGLPADHVDTVKSIRNELVHSGGFPASIEPLDGYAMVLGTAYTLLLRVAGYEAEIGWDPSS